MKQNTLCLSYTGKKEARIEAVGGDECEFLEVMLLYGRVELARRAGRVKPGEFCT